MAKRWVLGDQKHTVISCLPKNGSTSIKSCRGNTQYRTPSEALSCSVRVGIIRHPLVRLHSMYRFLRAQRASGATTLRLVPVKTYEAFIDYTLKHQDNHWKLQTELLETPEGQWVPNVMHRFEDLSSYWDQYFDVPLPHKNSSPVQHAVNEYKLDELTTKYQRDIDLWQSLGDKNDRERIRSTM